MAIIAKWSGDGLANGTSLGTTVGASTDTKFDTVVVTSPATVKVNDSPSLYTPRLEVLGANGVPTGNNPVHWYWQAALGSGPFPQHAVRFYLELADKPTGNALIFSVRDTSNVNLWWLDITALGILRLRNPFGTAVGLSKAALPVNQDLRIEGTYNAGNVMVQVFRGDSIVAIETLTGSNMNVSAVDGVTLLLPQQVRWGTPNNTAFLPHMFIDEMAFANTSDQIGPSWPSTPPFTLWNGSREIPADIYGLWDGATLKQIGGADIAP
jgi:hypothetical protein